MNGFKKEVVDMKREVENIKEESQSFAMQFVETLKIQNKRLFILCLVIFIAFCSLLGYTIWLHNDISTETEEIMQEITDVETIENSIIRNGGTWEE